MAKFECIQYGFYGVPLEYGEIRTTLGHNTDSYWIVNKKYDREYMEQQIRQFMVADHVWISCFWGAEAEAWASVYRDEIRHFTEKPAYLAPEVQVIKTKEGFLWELMSARSCRIVPCDTFLVFDDGDAYHEIRREFQKWQDWSVRRRWQ